VREGLSNHEAETSAMEAVKDFPFGTIIGRYRCDHNIDEVVAERYLRELKRFLMLAATSDRAYPMFGSDDGIDGVWHTFLLFTRQYADYCERLGQFVHHQPTVEGADPDPSYWDDYQDFLDRYVGVFDEAAPVDLWPRFFTWSDLLGEYETPPLPASR